MCKIKTKVQISFENFGIYFLLKTLENVNLSPIKMRNLPSLQPS